MCLGMHELRKLNVSGEVEQRFCPSQPPNCKRGVGAFSLGLFELFCCSKVDRIISSNNRERSTRTGKIRFVNLRIVALRIVEPAKSACPDLRCPSGQLTNSRLLFCDQPATDMLPLPILAAGAVLLCAVGTFLFHRRASALFSSLDSLSHKRGSGDEAEKIIVEHDVVVIGAGCSACALVSTLVKGGKRVLLLEGGEEDAYR